MDIQAPIRAAYYTALAGQLSALNGEGETVDVPIFDNVPAYQETPYVAFREQTLTDTNITAACTAYDATILLEIVTGYRGDLGGREQADLIADQIYALLPAIKAGITVGTLKSTNRQLDYSPPVEADNKKKYFRRLIRFRHILYA